MANISSLSSPSAKSRACHTHDLSLPACSCILVVATTVRMEKRVKQYSPMSKPIQQDRNRQRKSHKKTVITKMIGADLKRLRLTHHEADLGGLLVLEQLHSACSALFPLVPLLVEPVELRLPAQSPHVVRSTRPSHQIVSGRIGEGEDRSGRG